jgi:molybdopterin biosynthesis enzyme
MADDSSAQRITRLTPLGEVLALIDRRVNAVKPQRWAVRGTHGQTLAEDVFAGPCPRQPIALRDGYAVDSAVLADAGAYAPVPLSAPQRIEVGQKLPPQADAVLPLDAVAFRGDHVVAIAAVAAGEGVLPAGGDAVPQVPLRRAGGRVRTVDIAAMDTAGVEGISIREPRIAVVLGGEPGSRPLSAALALLVRAAFDAGAAVTHGVGASFDHAAADEQNAAIIAIGGTGSGRGDAVVAKLARLGEVAVHGIAISPGETTAFGFVGTRPVLLVPGRLDAALSAWLLIGRNIIAKLAAGTVEDAPRLLPLKRKVTSTIGLTELVQVRCTDGMAEPLASSYLSCAALARSDGWIVVPAASEGFASATPVAVRPWP